jgi:hypothetical protein
VRRRLALLLLPIAIIAWLVRPHFPTERPLQLHFGRSAPSLREAELVFEHDHAVVRDLTLAFPDGARPELSRPVRLAAGDYDIGVRLRYEGGRERHLGRTVHAEGDAPIDVDLE